MSDNRRYYYLKIKETFFSDEQMIVLESLPDGYLYSNILLKLYLCSLKNEGCLIFNNRIPYSPNVLASIVRHPVGVVEKALKIFQEFGLIEVLDNGAIFLLDIQNYIGESSTEADRQRAYQRRIADVKKQPLIETCKKSCKKSNSKSTPELELELEKELEKEKEGEKAPASEKIKQEDKNNPNGHPKRPTWKDRDQAEAIEKFIDFFLAAHPKPAKLTPATRDNCGKILDELIRLDKVDLAEARHWIGWACQDGFWQSNLLSLATLRTRSAKTGALKWETIRAKYEQSSASRSMGLTAADCEEVIAASMARRAQVQAKEEQQPLTRRIYHGQ